MPFIFIQIIYKRCSDPLDADLHLEKLKDKLLDKDYPEKMIKKVSVLLQTSKKMPIEK